MRMTFTKLLLFVSLAASMFAQPAPKFEVATVKPAAPDAVRNRVMPSSPDRLSIPSMSLTWLIYTAYQEGMGTSWNVSGGPDWVNNTSYSIEAKAAQPSTQKELRMMLRTLLAERFGLKIRQETRTGAPGTGGIYALVLDRSNGTLGPNIKEWDGTCGGRPPTGDDDPYTPRCPSGYRAGGFALEGGTLFSAAELLSLPASRQLLGTIVQDHTGLKGRYTMHLDFPFTAPRPAQLGQAAAAPSEFAGPSLFQEVRKQWGLKLEKAEGPLYVIVVESAQPPTEN
jgi:uncharacterized protein (TIGR03435 family)